MRSFFINHLLMPRCITRRFTTVLQKFEPTLFYNRLRGALKVDNDNNNDNDNDNNNNDNDNNVDNGNTKKNGNSQLTMVNQYYFNGGKMIRPLIVLHLSKCLAYAKKDFSSASYDSDYKDILPTQRRLAEIVEMIHAASLLHDDVVDDASLRRGRDSANVRFGAKSTILSGDFILAEAAIALAELENLDVIRLLPTAIKDLVEGEFMQMNATIKDQLCMSYYLKKSYLKTASLIAKSCQAAAMLSSHSPVIQNACYEFGRCAGLAFQITDDKLDFTSVKDVFGKEIGSDLRNGIVTAPVLFAIEEYPDLKDIVGRGFDQKDDYEIIFNKVLNGKALERTQTLVDELVNRSLTALRSMPDLCKESQQHLEELTMNLSNRSY